MNSSRSFTFVLGLATIAAMKTASAQTFTFPHPVVLTTDVGATASASGVAVNLTGQGSGTNGPATAQFGVNMGCAKDNWETTSSVGEIDCVNIALHQGGPGSDGSGILIGAENTGQGFINDIEMVASTLNPSTGQTPYYVDLQLGEVTSDARMYGAVVNALDGAGQSALFVNAEGSSSWADVLQAESGGAIYFSIDGSGNITTKGRVSTASLTTSGAVHAEAGVVTHVSQSEVIRKEDCGTIMRSTGAAPLTLVVPSGLPLGCDVNVIQASDGMITFQGRDMRGEHLGTADPKSFATQGRYAEADLLIDSPKTFLLRGDVGAGGAKSLDFVSDVRPVGPNARLTVLQ